MVARAYNGAGMCTRLSEPRPRRSKFCPRGDV